MKAICSSVALALVVLTGCHDASGPQKGSPSNNPAAAPADYLNNAAQAKQRAVKTVDLATVNKAIDRFYVEEGRFPKDLLQLVELDYLPLLPELLGGASWNYDTNNGVATIEKQAP